MKKETVKNMGLPYLNLEKVKKANGMFVKNACAYNGQKHQPKEEKNLRYESIKKTLTKS